MSQLAERIPVAERRPAGSIARQPKSAPEAQPSRSIARGRVVESASSPASETMELPARLRSGVEALSGIAMDDVRVHRNSSEPAKLGALAFTRGSEIHLGPGQEEHLPHEAWHVVQQKQGRVQATTQMKEERVAENRHLEVEADAMAPRLTGHLRPWSRRLLRTGPLGLVVQLKPKKGKKKEKPKENKLAYSKIKELVSANNNSGQSDELIIAIIYKESRFNTLEKAKRSTATGLMQVTQTAINELNKRAKTKYKLADMKDPAKAIAAGTEYLKLRISWVKGDVTAGLNGYGTGPGYADELIEAEKALKKGPEDPIDALTQAIGLP